MKGIKPDQLHEFFRYDPETGVLYWRERTECWTSNGEQCSEKERKRWNTRYAGKAAFGDNGQGYLRGGFLGQTAKAHRIIWAMQTGSWPEGVIDHINGNPSDNRWANLRAASHLQNMQNAKRRRDNKSGFRGVNQNRSRWEARITANGKTQHLGTFDTPEEAHAAYAKASAELHGEFGRVA